MDRFLGPQINKVDKSIFDDDSELRRMKSKTKKEGEKVFIQMVINDYICKGRSWEDLQKDFRPSGAMSKWTRDTAEILGLKSTTNYNLMSPSVSPISSPNKGSMKKRRGKRKTKSKPKSKTKAKSKRKTRKLTKRK
jgi:hypothetical protein